MSRVQTWERRSKKEGLVAAMRNLSKASELMGNSQASSQGRSFSRRGELRLCVRLCPEGAFAVFRKVSVVPTYQVTRGLAAPPLEISIRDLPTPAGTESSSDQNVIAKDIIGNQRPEIPKKLKKIYDLCKKGQADRALDKIFDLIDGYLSESDFSGCDAVLSRAEVDLLDVPCMLGFLSATYLRKANLPSRTEFYKAAYERIAGTRPNDVEKLIQRFE